MEYLVVLIVLSLIHKFYVYKYYLTTDSPLAITQIIGTLYNVCIVFPIIEEAVFRFMIPLWNDNAHIISIIFALVHISNLRIVNDKIAVGLQVTSAYFLSLVLSEYYFDYRSIIIHSIYNMINLFISIYVNNNFTKSSNPSDNEHIIIYKLSRSSSCGNILRKYDRYHTHEVKEVQVTHGCNFPKGWPRVYGQSNIY